MRPKGLSEAQASTESAAGLTSNTAVANASAEIAQFTSKRPRSGRVPGRSGRNRSTTNSVASTRTTTIVKLVRSIMIKPPRLFGKYMHTNIGQGHLARNRALETRRTPLDVVAPQLVQFAGLGLRPSPDGRSRSRTRRLAHRRRRLLAPLSPVSCPPRRAHLRHAGRRVTPRRRCIASLGRSCSRKSRRAWRRRGDLQ